MAGQPQTVQEQLDQENRARRIMKAALSNKPLMDQVRESLRLEAEGVKPLSRQEANI